MFDQSFIFWEVSEQMKSKENNWKTSKDGLFNIFWKNSRNMKEKQTLQN